MGWFRSYPYGSFSDLLFSFTQGDLEIETGLKRFWQNHNALPEDQQPLRGVVPTGNVTKRGIYASAVNPGARGIKAPAPNYNPVKVSVFPAKQKKPGSHVPAAGYAVQGKHIPTAYYVGPGGYVGPRR
jgi:hypothetical protein